MWLQAQQLVMRFCYLPSYHGDDVPSSFLSTLCMQPHQHSIYPQMHAHGPARRFLTAGLSHVLFSFSLDFTFLFFFVGCDYHIPLTVIPPGNNVPLCLTGVSPLWCPPFLLVCHLLLTHMCVRARDPALASDWCVGENWMKSFKCFPRDSDRSGLCSL